MACQRIPRTRASRCGTGFASARAHTHTHTYFYKLHAEFSTEMHYHIGNFTALRGSTFCNSSTVLDNLRWSGACSWRLLHFLFSDLELLLPFLEELQVVSQSPEIFGHVCFGRVFPEGLPATARVCQKRLGFKRRLLKLLDTLPNHLQCPASLEQMPQQEKKRTACSRMLAVSISWGTITRFFKKLPSS